MKNRVCSLERVRAAMMMILEKKKMEELSQRIEEEDRERERKGTNSSNEWDHPHYSFLRKKNFLLENELQVSGRMIDYYYY